MKLGFLILSAYLISANFALPQTPSSVPPGIDQINEQIKSTESNVNLSEELKKTIVDLYKKTLEALSNKDSFQKRSREIDEAVTNIPNRLKEIREFLSKPNPDPTPKMDPSTPLSQLETLLTEKETEYKTAQGNLSGILTEQEERVKKRSSLPPLINTAKEKLTEVIKQLSTAPPPAEAPELTTAKKTLFLAQKNSLEREIEALEKEIPSYDARTELLQFRRSQAEKALTIAEASVKAWREYVSQKRKEESLAAQTKAQEATQAAINAHPIIKRLAEENEKLAKVRNELTDKRTTITQKIDETRQLLRKTQETFKSLSRKIEASKFTSTLGVLLRTQQKRLPNLRDLENSIKDYEEEISEVEVWLIDLEEMRRLSLQDKISLLLEKIGNTGDPLPKEVQTSIEKQIQESRINFVIPLYSDYESYANQLSDLDVEQRSLIQEVRNFSSYIAKRILWSRSAHALSLNDIEKSSSALSWLVSGKSWNQILSSLKAERASHPYDILILLAIPTLLLIALYRMLSKKIITFGIEAQKNHLSNLSATTKTFFITFLLAITLPCVLSLMGWWFLEISNVNSLGSSIAAGLLLTSIVLLKAELLRQICRKDGLGVKHFNWNPKTISVIRKNNLLLYLVLIPFFFVTLFEFQRTEEFKESIGRICFIISMGIFSYYLLKIFHPKRGILQHSKQKSSPNSLFRFQTIVFVLLLAIPFSLIVLATVGYYFTSVQLAWKIVITFGLSIVIILLHAYLQRWLLLTKRKLAIKQAKEKRKLLLEKQETDRKGETDANPIIVAEEQEIDIAKLNTQTTRFLRFTMIAFFVIGVWTVWIDVLPALGIFNDVNLGWTKIIKVPETVLEKSPSGEERTVERLAEKEVPVTFSDLGVAILIGIIALISARNLPGLLQLSILQKFPLDSGTRYAITAIFGYIITLTGIILVFGFMGVSWSKVQWLAAALTVGLGFGLQEIFANFVSGLIILFERPVRVGDIVTIDAVTGTVTKIKIRATTVTDWDRKEFVVPNKDFITGRLLNWTLSNTTNRIKFPVGIAYGSDVKKALALLKQVAIKNKNVLSDPEPVTTFEEFAESSLTIVLRCFVPNMEVRVPTISELHIEIEKTFGEAEIEISFPQRDLHIRSSDGILNIHSTQDRSEAEEPKY